MLESSAKTRRCIIFDFVTQRLDMQKSGREIAWFKAMTVNSYETGNRKPGQLRTGNRNRKPGQLRTGNRDSSGTGNRDSSELTATVIEVRWLLG